MRAFFLELPRFQRALAAILLAHLLAIMAMVASPTLHSWVHHEAQDTDHECAVVLFAGGGAEPLTVIIIVVALVARAGSIPLPRTERVETIFRVLRILEHAPPAAA